MQPDAVCLVASVRALKMHSGDFRVVARVKMKPGMGDEYYEMAQTILCALEPETESVPSERATTTIRADESKLVLEILAEDLTALRAAMNSFLAWISGAKRALEYVNSH